VAVQAEVILKLQTRVRVNLKGRQIWMGALKDRTLKNLLNDYLPIYLSHYAFIWRLIIILSWVSIYHK
jgi:hypothetical protein